MYFRQQVKKDSLAPAAHIFGTKREKKKGSERRVRILRRNRPQDKRIHSHDFLIYKTQVCCCGMLPVQGHGTTMSPRGKTEGSIGPSISASANASRLLPDVS